MATDHDVFQCGHLGKQADVLKSAGNARLRHLMNRGGLVGLARQHEVAAVRRVQTRDDVEEGGFACPIGTNQAVHLTSLNRHAHIGQRLQTAKAFGDALHLQHRGAHGLAPLTGKSLPCSGAGHKPRGRHNMMRIMAKAMSNWRKMAASKRPSVMACNGPAT